MGKNKAQRTKNNARPSNSNRSAEFLGASTPSFVGFAAAKDGGYVPLLPGLSITNNTELNNIDSNFQLVLKKMNKKDATTKYKALLEFSELCSKSELSIVEAMLPVWPRTYSTLAIDVDHRVREGVQLAHGNLVKKVGKNIALYLKQLAGPWFVSQYDVYPPAASAASNCFSSTFPPQKYVSAIVHCQDEILTYICDNIKDLTPQALTTNKSYTPEEIQAKYDRIISSSLLAYAFYLKTVSPADIEKTAEFHKALISSKQFWKLAKNEVVTIKTAFFNALTALLCHANSIICIEKKKVLTTVINCIEESDPTLLSAVWECLLIAVNKIEDWQKVVSIEKLVLPKLWRVLKNGGQYAASVVYPNLLPLLSQFMNVEINTAVLFTNFFENMREGFSAKSLKLSRSEAFAVITSFVECFKYTTLKNCENEEFCKNLLKDQLMPVIESCFCDHQELKRILFCELAHLLRYWCKNSNNPEFPAYQKLLKTFWFELVAIFNRLVDSDCQEIVTSSVVSSMSELLLYLKNAPAHSRRNMKVKFSDSTESLSSPDLSEHSMVLINDSENTAFIQELQQLVIKLCVCYFKRVTEKPDKHKVNYLIKIISGYESQELFITLAKTYDEEANLLKFYNKHLKSFMCTENEDIEALISLIFSLMSNMTNSEKEEVLESFKEIDDVKILKAAVQCALMKRYREDSIVRKWCSQCVITNTLVLTAQDVVSSLDLKEFDEKIFTLAFEPAMDGDLIVNSEAICGISSLLCLTVDRIPWENEKKSQRFAVLLSRLLELSWSHKELNPGATQLLKALFRLHIRDIVERGEEISNSSVSIIVQEAWTNGLLELSKRVTEVSFVDHVKYFSTIIWEKIFETSEICKASLINLTTNFVSALIKSNKHLSGNFVNIFMTELEIHSWIKHSAGLVFYGEVIKGNFYSSDLSMEGEVSQKLFSINLLNDDFEDNTHKCMKWAAISSEVILYILQNVNDPPDIKENLVNLAYLTIIGEFYIEHYSFTKYSSEVKELWQFMQKSLNEMKAILPEDIHEEVLREIKRLMLSYGGFYPYSFKFYANFSASCNSNKNYEEIIKEAFGSLTEISNNLEILLQRSQVVEKLKNVKTIYNDTFSYDDYDTIFWARNRIHDQIDINYPQKVFQIIEKLQKTESSLLLLDTTSNVQDVPWKSLVLPLEIVYFFTDCVNFIPKKLNLSEWDLIEICLCSWNQSIKNSFGHEKDFKVKAFIVSVNNLYLSIQTLMNKHIREPIEELPVSLLDEWNNVFVNDLETGILDIWMTLAEHTNEKEIPAVSMLSLNYLGNSLTVFNKPITNDNVKQKKEEILKSLLKYILSPVLSIQLGAYITLNNLLDDLVEKDKKLIEVENFEDLKSLNLCKFEQVLKTSQTIVNALLAEFKLCDSVSCTILPYTDSYTYTIGYLFTWNIIINMCAKAHGDLRYYYAEILKNDFFPSVLNNIFRLMPVEVLLDKKNKNPNLIEAFTTKPQFDFKGSWTEQRLDHLVCWLYTNCLRYLPVLVRQWWSTADSRVSMAVDKITALYVTSYLCNEELHDTNVKLANVENMEVKVHPVSREVVALYQMDDATLELNIILPPNHPLGTVTVERGQHTGHRASNWKNDHMQLSIFLMHQNGSIWDGLMLWKKNLDKRFAGVEECYICFSIFHVSTYQIPKLSCRTCRKKFHSECLYKWFNTSNKSACPICRMVF